MTLTLILTRHAKSSWTDPELSDHERPLNKRGRASAKAIGRWLAARGHDPQEVICSDAERTRETWAFVSDHLIGPVKTSYTSALYLAEPEKMLDVLQGANASIVMMIAHNPGAAYTARKLLQSHPDHPRFGHYPTAATTVIRFDAARWADVTWGSGELVDFIVPRDLI